MLAVLDSTVLIDFLRGLDTDAARLAGRWRRRNADQGVTLWQADCLIAVVTHLRAGRLCTGHPKDFPMLDVEHWPVGA